LGVFFEQFERSNREATVGVPLWVSLSGAGCAEGVRRGASRRREGLDLDGRSAHTQFLHHRPY
jgi:hypothetical protein